MVALDKLDLEVLALSFGVPLLLGGIAFFVIYLLTHQPELPPLMGPDGVVRLAGQLTPASTWISFSQRTLGRVEVTPWELIWRPSVGPEWRVPITAMLLRPPGFFEQYNGIEFETPWTGRLYLVVSDGPIGPLVLDFEKGRVRQRSGELRHVLLSRGARMVAR